MRTLAAIGFDAEPSAGKIKTYVGAESDEVRSVALETLSKVMRDRQELIAILSDRLADNNWTVRKQAATLLGAEGEDAISAVPALIDLLQSDDDSDYARDALRGIDAAPPEAVPQLVKILKNDSGRRARYYAMHLLKKIGPAAKEAIPELRAILSEGKFDSRSLTYLESAIQEIEEQNADE
jgi:HEAT repeat protein